MVEYSTIEPWKAVDENGVVYDQGSLMAYFYKLVDPRKARGKRYQLEPLLVLVFLAKLSGMDGRHCRCVSGASGRLCRLVALALSGDA